MKHILFICNVPAFYKLNLFNKLTDYFKVTVILLGTTNQVLTESIHRYCSFEVVNISNDDMDDKLKGVMRIPRLIKEIFSIKFDYIVYSGWDNIDMVIALLLTPRKKNCVIVESTIFESCFTGVKGWIKRLIVSRFSKAFPSGKPHVELLRKLRFKGQTYITGSVGITNLIKRNETIQRKNDQIRFLYIGRLIDVKNITLLVDIFNTLDKPLTVVGTGY